MFLCPVALKRCDFNLHVFVSDGSAISWVNYRVVRKLLKYPFIFQRLSKDTGIESMFREYLENSEHLVPCVFFSSRPFSMVRGALGKCRFQRLYRRYLTGHLTSLLSTVTLYHLLLRWNVLHVCVCSMAICVPILHHSLRKCLILRTDSVLRCS